MGFLDWLNRFSASVKPAGDLTDLLKQTKRLNGTELRITPGVVPQAMIKDRLFPLSDLPLENEACKNMCYKLFTDRQREEFDKNKKIEFAFGVKDIGRYKTNIVSAEGRVSGIFTILVQSASYSNKGQGR